MKKGREISSGGVIYKKDGGTIKIALISRKKGEIWGLPKGKVEKNESPDVTALREVKEETGLEGEIEKKIGDINYYYYSKQNDTRYFKTVSFYLIHHTGGSSKHHDWEVDDCKWFSVEEALNIMTYEGEKDMVGKAKAILE